MNQIQSLRNQARIESIKGNIYNAKAIYERIFEMEDKIKVSAILEERAYHQIEIDIPRRDLTLAEAEELLDKLQAEIKITKQWEAVKK